MLLSTVERKKPRARVWRGATVALLLALFWAKGALADTTLAPGNAYDISTLGRGAIKITQPGDYTLSGSNGNAYVIIDSAGVNLYLANGLRIDVGIGAHSGQSASAICVKKHAGDVKIISKPNAYVFLKGYLAPGIEKSGWDTHLIFDTEDAAHPGAIEVQAGTFGAGIGNQYNPLPKEGTGHISVYGGKLIARGGYCGAGIGTAGGYASNIHIAGGEVRAIGGSGGAGIGGGINGPAYDIFITGGTVYAKGDEGAGIGGGGNSDEGPSQLCKADRITISGGSVEAYGDIRAAAIGGGFKSDGTGILISGGTVYAKGKDYSTAIGGGGSNFSGGKGVVTITGGYVTALGGQYAYDIGSGGSDAVTSAVTITGGTVVTTNGRKDLGGKKGSVVMITGGSVKANKNQNAAVNASGQPVFKTAVTVFGATNGTALASVAGTESAVAYGMHDVVTMDTNQLYLWLPNGGGIFSGAAPSGRPYYTTFVIPGGGAGTLYPSTAVTLNKGPNGLSDGMGYGVLGQTSLVSLVPVTPKPGFHMVSYDEGYTTIVWPDGRLNGLNVNPYVDPSGQWVAQNDSVTLEAVIRPNEYTVAFEQNRPSTASHAVTGDMSTQSFQYDDIARPLQQNGFSLPGWSFTGWNTLADGTGTAYTDQQPVRNLAAGHGAVVTLYAQWTAKTYTVVFLSNEVGTTGVTNPQTLTYDQPATLTPNGYVVPGKHFLGWRRAIALGGSLYGDQARVTNLCGIDPANGRLLPWELEAVWGMTGSVYVTVTNDTLPVTGLERKLSLQGPGTVLSGFAAAGNGYYSLAGVPDGVYTVLVDGYEPAGATLTVDASGTGAATVAYCTLSISAEPHARAWIAWNGAELGRQTFVPVGASRAIAAETEPGYLFEAYTALGTQPGWQNNNPALARQTVTVNGQAELQAHPAPARYQVSFYANGGQGSMPTQDMVFDEPQPLFPCAFFRFACTFAGWSLTPNGAVAYADQAAVENLTVHHGEVIPLYAVWAQNAPMIFGPDDQTVMEGEPVTFAVLAIDAGALSYRWEQSRDDGLTWAQIGENDYMLSLTSASMDWDGALFRCTATDGRGASVTSRRATLRVHSYPPTTGDAAQPWLYGLALAGCALLFALLAATKRRRFD